MNRLYRLRTILLVVMISVLTLPAGAVYVFRIFENELVRETEQELISQAAALGATWRSLLTGSEAPQTNAELHPIFPELDLRNPIAPPRPDAVPPRAAPDPDLQTATRTMERIMLEAQRVTLAGMRLLDAHGTVLAGRDETGLSLAHVPEVQQAMRGLYASVIRRRISDQPRPSIYSVSRGTDIRVFVALPVLDEDRVLGIVYLSRTPVSILKRLFTVRNEIALAVLVMAGLTVLLGLFVSSSIARPIRELLHQMERLRRGEIRTVQPIARPVTHEVAQLSERFAAMSDALAERSDYIRQFAGHVSHEFKTPLTSMQGALELLMDHLETMEPERVRRFLDNLLADSRRLQQLVNRMLELARADAMPPSRDRCSLGAAAETLQSVFRDRGLQVRLNTDTDTDLPMSCDALHMVLANLAENSLQHGADRLHLIVPESAAGLRLTVGDNGRGISPANRDRIFTPFFTTRRDTGGTGLGLEICRSVLKACGGTIALGSAENGTTFVLEFPHA